MKTLGKNEFNKKYGRGKHSDRAIQIEEEVRGGLNRQSYLAMYY